MASPHPVENHIAILRRSAHVLFVALLAFAPHVHSAEQSPPKVWPTLSEPEIRARLNAASREADGIRRQTVPWNPGSTYMDGLEAAYALRELPTDQAVPLILLGTASYSDSIRLESAHALAFHHGPRAMELFRAILTNDFQRFQPLPKGYLTDDHVRRATALYYGNMLGQPDFADVLSQTLDRSRDSDVRRSLAATISTCTSPACFELILKHAGDADSFVGAEFIRALKNFSDSPRLLELIQKFQASDKPTLRSAAIFAARNRSAPGLDKVMIDATKALYSLTRMEAYQGLRGYNVRDIPNLYDIYASGLLDSRQEVRYVVIHELGDRNDPESRMLLTRVRYFDNVRHIRTPWQQKRLAPLSEILADAARATLRSSRGTPNIEYLERLGEELAIAKKIIHVWTQQGLTEDKIAAWLLDRNVSGRLFAKANRREGAVLDVKPFQKLKGPVCEALFKSL